MDSVHHTKCTRVRGSSPLRQPNLPQDTGEGEKIPNVSHITFLFPTQLPTKQSIKCLLPPPINVLGSMFFDIWKGVPVEKTEICTFKVCIVRYVLVCFVTADEVKILTKMWYLQSLNVWKVWNRNVKVMHSSKFVFLLTYSYTKCYEPDNQKEKDKVYYF